MPKSVLGYLARYLEGFCGMVLKMLEYRPDIIHAHEPESLPIAFLARLLLGTRIVYDAHELYRDSDRTARPVSLRAATVLEDIGMSVASAVIACNRDRADIMHNQYGCRGFPYVIRNVPPYRRPVASAALTSAMAEKNSEVRYVCLYQGALVRSRGIDTLVRSLALLPGTIGAAILGGGEVGLRREIETLAHELGVANRFLMTGPVDYRKLHILTCSAHLGVVLYRPTCLNNYYCAPNKIYEYAAAGVPIVAPNLPPIARFLQEHPCGELFEPGSIEGLADAIMRILADPSRLRAYRCAALAAARINCWEVEGEAMRRIYAKLNAIPPRSSCG